MSRFGIMGTGRNDLRGFQPDRRVRKVRPFPARPRPDRAGNRCGPPVRPPAHALQVMGLMINRFAVLQNIRIGSLKYDVIKVDREPYQYSTRSPDMVLYLLIWFFIISMLTARSFHS